MMGKVHQFSVSVFEVNSIFEYVITQVIHDKQICQVCQIWQI